MMKNTLLAILVVPLLGSCLQQPTAQSSYNRGSYCAVINSGEDAAKNCRDGDVVVWLPSSWGNDQIPIVTAALMCDFDKPIVHNSAGVSCIYRSEGYKTFKEKMSQNK